MLEIFNQNEKAFRLIQSSYLDTMVKALKAADAPYTEEFKKGMIDTLMSKERVSNIIDSAPRGAFDILDSNGLCIEITTVEDPMRFTYAINKKGSGLLFNSRQECERASVVEAIHLLNEKL